MLNNIRLILYYLVLLVFIALLSGFLVQPHPQGMSMSTMISVSVLLGIYVVLMSFIGEGKTTDERAEAHRYTANRQSLIAGTILLSIGVLYQLFTHTLDYWLLAGLIVINFVKIVSLIYSDYRH